MTVAARDLYWAAGFLEGEGSFGLARKTVNISADQVQREPLERLQRIFGGPIYQCSPKGRQVQPYFKWNVYGPRAAGVAMTLFAIMSPRRQQQIVSALEAWKNSTSLSNASKTSCKRGHAFDESNTYTRNGKRACKTCKIEHQRRKRDELKSLSLEK